jgi:transmembrane sensor
MAYNPFYIAELITAYFQGTLSEAQQVELNLWLEKKENKAFLEELSNEENLPQKLMMFGRLREQAIWDKTLLGLQESNVVQISLPNPNLLRYKFLTIAAAVVIVVFGIYFFNNNNTSNNIPLIAQDIAPGKTGATLTLANGKKIRLNEVANGELAKEAGVVITKSANGDLIYEIKDKAGESNKVNTLSTANGELYNLRLPDGSHVWLNSASSLTYTANLIKNGRRKVKLDGEAYFEVAKDKAHPFIVESKGQEVEVLGTHFNINSYADEGNTKTTLLEGKVNISSFKEGTIHQSQVLRPNQQAVNTGSTIKVAEVDAADVIGWKNGKFVFDNEGIETVMRKISRWYNVEIIYQEDISGIKVTGGIPRSKNVSKILEMLENTDGVHFKIEDKKIIVKK